MVTLLTVLEVLGVFLILPLIIGLIVISLVFTFQSLKKSMSENHEQKLIDLVCKIDADCPEGYLCVNGQCIPQNDVFSSTAQV